MTDLGRVLAVGSINLDLQVRAEGFPRESETAMARDFLRAGGGKAANVAVVAARLGVPSRLIGRVGDDVFADLALAGPREAAVDLEAVRRVPGAATGTSLIVVRDDGDKTIVLAANANDDWEHGADAALAQCVRAAEAGSVLVVDLEVPPPIVRAALTAARERALTTVLDPSPASRMDDALYALCDFVTPNPREAKHLTGVQIDGEDAAVRAGRALVERGVRHACMKLPDGGAALVTREGVAIVRAPRVEVVDKTGAGDAFAGGLAAALAEGRTPREAVARAVLTSTFAVTRYGSQAAYPTGAELARFAAEGRA